MRLSLNLPEYAALLIVLTCVKITLSRVKVLSFFALNFKTMFTWCNRPPYVFLSSMSLVSALLSHCWIFSSTQKSPIHQTGLRQLLSFILLFPLSILVNILLTSPGSFAQDLLILVFPIHDFSECVTGIFSLVTGDDIMRDSCILDILLSSIHNIPKFSLCDPFHMPREILFWGVLSHDLSRVIFTINILDINIIFFHHVSQKMVINIKVFCTNTYLPVLL